MFKTILVCSDGSEHSMKAAREAAIIAKQSDACVLLLNVNSNVEALSPCIMPWQMEVNESQSPHDLNETQECALKRAEILFDKDEVRYVSLREFGHPAAQIVRVAEREEADLIVLGSRGLNVLESLLLGSVSDHVVRHAHCSVLVVR